MASVARPLQINYPLAIAMATPNIIFRKEFQIFLPTQTKSYLNFIVRKLMDYLMHLFGRLFPRNQHRTDDCRAYENDGTLMFYGNYEPTRWNGLWKFIRRHFERGQGWQKSSTVLNDSPRNDPRILLAARPLHHK